ncbi:MAG: hypothetical protein ABH823_03925 [bacterium]
MTDPTIGARIDGASLGVCAAPRHGIAVDDPYSSSCADFAPETFPETPLLDNLEYSKAKGEAIADIEREFIQPSDVDGDVEKKYEGYIVAWLLQREIGHEDTQLYGRSSLSLLNEAIEFFIDYPSQLNLATLSTYNIQVQKRVKKIQDKIKYWRIRLTLVLLEDIRRGDPSHKTAFRKIFEGGFTDRLGRWHSNKEFFALGNIDFTQPRKKIIATVLKKLEAHAKDYGDPALLAEIYFKLGIQQNENGHYEGPEGSKDYFARAETETKKILKGVVAKSQLAALVPNPDAVWAALLSKGYIDENGIVQRRFPDKLIKFSPGLGLSQSVKKQIFELLEKAQKALSAYKRHFVANRVDNVENKILVDSVIIDYYQVQEMYSVVAGAHKMAAQLILLKARDGAEITYEELKQALEHTRIAETIIVHYPKRHNYRNKEYLDNPKGTIYSYFGSVYRFLDLERLHADISVRLALLLTDSCPQEAKKHLKEAEEILDKITKWETTFMADRRACDYMIWLRSKRLVGQGSVDKCLEMDSKGEWKTHSLIEEDGVAIFSEWGASIIGSIHLAKARLLMSTYPKDPANPRGNLRDAKIELDKAEKFLVRDDDFSLFSTYAEYFIRMNLDIIPPLNQDFFDAWQTFRDADYGQAGSFRQGIAGIDDLAVRWQDYLQTRLGLTFSQEVATALCQVLFGKEILDKTPAGFIYGRLTLARVYIKAEQFKKAEAFLIGILKDPGYQPTFLIEEEAVQAAADQPIDYRPIMTPRLRSSIYQTLAELALEDDDLIKAEELFTKSICYYPYNVYTQLALGDLANWRGDFKTAREIYHRIERDPRFSIEIKRRVKLALAEVDLREATLNPGNDASAQAEAIIKIALEILEKSEESFMLGRALESLIEGLIAKKDEGLAQLETLRDELLASNFDIKRYLRGETKDPGKTTAIINPLLRDRVQASIYLKIADGFLFVHEYEEAEKIIALFEGIYDEAERQQLKARYPSIYVHYLVSSAEIAQRINQYDEAAILKIFEAATILFAPEPAMPDAKRDPYLASRVVKDIIDIYVNKDEFELALAMCFAAQGLTLDTKFSELTEQSGLIDPAKYAAAKEAVARILQGVDIKKIFERKGLLLKHKLFAIDIHLKQVEILTWVKNFDLAGRELALVESERRDFATTYGAVLDPRFAEQQKLQLARIALVRGNIAAQWLRKQDYELAREFYEIALGHLRGLTARFHGQERILVETELYSNFGNIYRFGQTVKDLDLAQKYYRLAEERARLIRGNDDLKYFHLARIYFGLAKLAEEKSAVTLQTFSEEEFAGKRDGIAIALTVAGYLDKRGNITPAFDPKDKTKFLIDFNPAPNVVVLTKENKERIFAILHSLKLAGKIYIYGTFSRQEFGDKGKKIVAALTTAGYLDNQGNLTASFDSENEKSFWLISIHLPRLLL